MSIGANLRRLREERGWSQSETAKAAGLSVRNYENWEVDRREPKLDAARRLASAFGVLIEELLVGVEGGE